jgi:hypothetical protein
MTIWHMKKSALFVVSTVISAFWQPSAAQIPHARTRVPTVDLRGELIGWSDKGETKSVRIVQQVGLGGRVEHLFMLRGPSLGDLLRDTADQNLASQIRAVSVAVDSRGQFEYQFPAASYYSVAPPPDLDLLSMIAFVIKLPVADEPMYGIEFPRGQPVVFELDRERWEFNKIDSAAGDARLTVEVSPSTSNDVREVRIRVRK